MDGWMEGGREGGREWGREGGSERASEGGANATDDACVKGNQKLVCLHVSELALKKPLKSPFSNVPIEKKASPFSKKKKKKLALSPISPTSQSREREIFVVRCMYVVCTLYSLL